MEQGESDLVAQPEDHVGSLAVQPDHTDIQSTAQHEPGDMADQPGESDQQEQGVYCPDCTSVTTVKSDFAKFMELQNAGLTSDYKCVKCRKCLDCVQGSMYKKVYQGRAGARVD